MKEERIEIDNDGNVIPLEPTPDSRAWSALADEHLDNERRFLQVHARIDRLEKKITGGTAEQLIDNRTIGMLIAITVIPIALQVVGMLLARRAAAETGAT